jgi:glycosyltransferase involved in cell wall biosynthesis
MPDARILHLDTGRDWRGGQRQVFLLAAALRDAGHEGLVVTAPDSPLAARLNEAGIATAPIRMRGDLDLLAMRALRRLVRQWRPSVVHAHDARSHAVALGALLGTGIPLVVSRRMPNVPKSRLKYGSLVSHFIAVSGAVQESLARGGVPLERSTVVYDGVPTPKVTKPRDWRREAGFPSDAVICGVVGAMTAEKGIDKLAAIASALSRSAHERVRLVLLGGKAVGADSFGGIPAYRAGFIDGIHDAMAGLDLLWHPSTTEGLGSAVLDAMALGVPPVAFATGGLPEVVENEVSGLLAPSGDVAAFAHDVERLQEDVALCRKLRDGGVRRAAQFNVPRMVDGTTDVYQRAGGRVSGVRAIA